jgi:hypothetical protein
MDEILALPTSYIEENRMTKQNKKHQTMVSERNKRHINIIRKDIQTNISCTIPLDRIVVLIWISVVNCDCEKTFGTANKQTIKKLSNHAIHIANTFKRTHFYFEIKIQTCSLKIPQKQKQNDNNNNDE